MTNEQTDRFRRDPWTLSLFLVVLMPLFNELCRYETSIDLSRDEVRTPTSAQVADFPANNGYRFEP